MTERNERVEHTSPVTCSPEQFLAAENAALRRAGCKMAEAALHVARESDGVHRLMLAVSEWAKAVADEGGRRYRKGSRLMSAAKNSVHPLVGSLTSRRAKSLLRAEDVARELRHQLAYSQGREELDMARLFELVAKWMRVTGNVKYIRPNNALFVKAGIRRDG